MRKRPQTCPRYRGITAHIVTAIAVLPQLFYRPRGNYRGYRGITAIPVTVSLSSTQRNLLICRGFRAQNDTTDVVIWHILYIILINEISFF